MTISRRDDLNRAAAIAEKTQEIDDLRLQLAAANTRAAGADGANEMVQHLIDQNIVEMDADRNIQMNPNLIVPNQSQAS